VGLDEPSALLPDTAAVRRLLLDLEHGAGIDPPTPEAGLALARLDEAGLLVDRASLDHALVSTPSESSARAAFAAYGQAAVDRLAARARCRVRIVAPEPWQTITGDWVRAAGLATRGTAPDRADDNPAVTLLVSLGEPARDPLDDLMREDRDHLLVRLFPERAVVGPFVRPGVTACVRCLDAHDGERDPRRGLLLAQLDRDQVRTAATDPFDPLLAHVGVALAVRDLVALAEGERPASWSATLTLSGALRTEHRTWSRHPHCGCCWAEAP